MRGIKARLEKREREGKERFRREGKWGQGGDYGQRDRRLREEKIIRSCGKRQAVNDAVQRRPCVKRGNVLYGYERVWHDNICDAKGKKNLIGKTRLHCMESHTFALLLFFSLPSAVPEEEDGIYRLHVKKIFKVAYFLQCCGMPSIKHCKLLFLGLSNFAPFGNCSGGGEGSERARAFHRRCLLLLLLRFFSLFPSPGRKRKSDCYSKRGEGEKRGVCNYLPPFWSEWKSVSDRKHH